MIPREEDISYNYEGQMDTGGTVYGVDDGGDGIWDGHLHPIKTCDNTAISTMHFIEM